MASGIATCSSSALCCLHGRVTARSARSCPAVLSARPARHCHRNDIPSHLHSLRRARASAVDPLEMGEDSVSESGSDYCMPAEITVDNNGDNKFTLVTVDVQDYPGLVRVLAWALNGMDVIVENAKLKTDPEGMARNTFWVTDSRGRKLSQQRADFVAERLSDYITYCTPDEQELRATVWEQGPVAINNDESEVHTTVSVGLPRRKQTALLEIASTITGCGIKIHEAVIQGSCGGPYSPQGAKGTGDDELRTYKFWVTDSRNHKLDYSRAAALLFTLALVFGKAHFPLQPPGAKSLQYR